MTHRSRLLAGFALLGLSLAAHAVPIHWSLTINNFNDRFINAAAAKNSVILVNGTATTRVYEFDARYLYKGPVTPKGYSWRYFPKTSYQMTLPPNTFCTLDEAVMPPLTPEDSKKKHLWRHPIFLLNNADGVYAGSLVKDITDPNDPIYNGAIRDSYDDNKYSTPLLRIISTCSAWGDDSCASGKWGSWTVGVTNLGGKTLQKGDALLSQHTTYFVPDYSWNSRSGIKIDPEWFHEKIALILYQGTTTGDGFAPVYPNYARPHQVCSKYVTQQ